MILRFTADVITIILSQTVYADRCGSWHDKMLVWRAELDSGIYTRGKLMTTITIMVGVYATTNSTSIKHLIARSQQCRKLAAGAMKTLIVYFNLKILIIFMQMH